MLRKLVTEAAEPLRPLFTAKSVELTIDLPEDVHIEADRDTITIVFRNILSNALKFSYNDSTVSVAGEVKDGRCAVSFRDNGVGMEITPELFDYASGSPARGTANEKGSGLGLHLIKQFAEENGALIHIHSRPGEGTTIILSFPLMDNK